MKRPHGIGLLTPSWCWIATVVFAAIQRSPPVLTLSYVNEANVSGVRSPLSNHGRSVLDQRSVASDTVHETRWNGRAFSILTARGGGLSMS